MSYCYEDLNQLQKELVAKNPLDILQFCANYFNTKLARQRSQMWQMQAKAQSAGIELFSEVESVAVDNQGLDVIPTATQPSFKSPFDDNDPHAEHTKDAHRPDTQNNPQGGAGLFKGAFKADSSAPKAAADLKPYDASCKAGLPSAVNPSIKLPALFNANRRVSVSAEPLNPDKFKTDSWTPAKNNLTEEQRAELSNTLSSNFLFQQFDANSKSTVLSALVKMTFRKGTEIITQGDEGDYFYIIETGTVDFYVNGVKVNTSSDGYSFGELALMYNAPRAATALAATDVTCWTLDRATFRRILLETNFNRRIMYEDFLRKVDVLAGLTPQERSKLADALSTETYQPGDKIVTEGEIGEKFYLIESGTCEISKKGEGVIGTIGKGSYFGEVALLNDLPRQATVTAKDLVNVATLGKSGFTRLLGPALDVLRKQDPTQQ